MTNNDLMKYIASIQNQAEFISSLREEPISANAARVILEHIRRMKEALHDYHA